MINKSQQTKAIGSPWKGRRRLHQCIADEPTGFVSVTCTLAQQHCARRCVKCCSASIRVRIQGFRVCERKCDSWMNWNQLVKGTTDPQPGADQNPSDGDGVSVMRGRENDDRVQELMHGINLFTTDAAPTIFILLNLLNSRAELNLKQFRWLQLSFTLDWVAILRSA